MKLPPLRPLTRGRGGQSNPNPTDEKPVSNFEIKCRYTQGKTISILDPVTMTWYKIDTRESHSLPDWVHNRARSHLRATLEKREEQ